MADMSGEPVPPLLSIKGDWSKGDGPRMLDRILNAICGNPAVLLKRWWGLKHYDRFSYQGFDCPPGCAPRHYSTIPSRIEVSPEWRERLRHGESPPSWVIVQACNAVRAAVATSGRTVPPTSIPDLD